MEEDLMAISISADDIPPNLQFSVAQDSEEKTENEGYENLTLDSDGDQDNPAQERQVMFISTEEDTEKAEQSINEIIQAPSQASPTRPFNKS